MKYKVGDKVKIREDLVVGNKYGADKFVSDMEQYKGEIATIAYITNSSKYHLDIDDDYWSWTDEMLEDVIIESENEDEKIINTVDIGFYLNYCGFRVIENVYYGGYVRHDRDHVFCTTIDDKNQYVLPVNSIEFIVPHED